MPKKHTLKVIAMPSDANPDGDVFGGWIISQMDLAGSLVARKVAKNRVATVAIQNIEFKKPVFIGDCIEVFTSVTKVGNTSISVDVETIVERREGNKKELVTSGTFIFVSIDENRRPKIIKKR